MRTSLPECVLTPRSFSLERGKKEKRKAFPFLFDVHTHVSASRLLFFYLLLAEKELARKTSSPALFFFLLIFKPDTFLLKSRLWNESHLQPFLLVPGCSVNLRSD